VLRDRYQPSGERGPAAAVELGGGLVLTTNPEDLSRLAASYGNVTVIGLP
jgi:hypothetical protein